MVNCQGTPLLSKVVPSELILKKYSVFGFSPVRVMLWVTNLSSFSVSLIKVPTFLFVPYETNPVVWSSVIQEIVAEESVRLLILTSFGVIVGPAPILNI